MQEEKLLDERSARVVDLLDQIKKVNQMIDMHQNQSKDNFMVRQYQDIRQHFLSELKEILSEFNIEVQLNNEAA